MNPEQERMLRLEAALKAAEWFIADELECREASMLPLEVDDDINAQYIISARSALATVRAALGVAA